MSSRPPLGAEVALERGGSAWLAARVTGRDGDHDLLAVEPHGAAEAPVEANASTVCDAIMVWSTEHGVFRATATVAIDGTRARATVHASATRTQRREYVRLPMDTQMTLAHADGIARGTLIDLSEAALRLRLPAQGAPRLAPGAQVRSAFTLHHTGFMLRGTVLREQASGAPDTIDVVVMLDIPARTANDLRRNVVFEQIERQSELHGTDDASRRDVP